MGKCSQSHSSRERDMEIVCEKETEDRND